MTNIVLIEYSNYPEFIQNLYTNGIIIIIIIIIFILNTSPFQHAKLVLDDERLLQGKPLNLGDPLQELTWPLVDQSPSGSGPFMGVLELILVTGCLSWHQPAAD